MVVCNYKKPLMELFQRLAEEGKPFTLKGVQQKVGCTYSYISIVVRIMLCRELLDYDMVRLKGDYPKPHPNSQVFCFVRKQNG